MSGSGDISLRVTTTGLSDTAREVITVVGDEKFTVRLATSQEDFDFATELILAEGWAVGPKDVSHLNPVVQPGYFIGVLEGQRIGVVMANKFGDKAECGLYYLDFYVVHKRYRGMGYGLKLWNVMWEALEKNCSICLDAVLDMVPQYSKLGFKSKWDSKEYVVSAAKTSKFLADSSQKIVHCAEIQKFSTASFDSIIKYDTSVFGISHRDYISKWMSLPTGQCWVAKNAENGEIVGYAFVRQSAVDDEEKLIAPLFADNINVAERLLYHIAKNDDGQKKLKLFVPVNNNPDNMVHTIETKIGVECVPSTFTHMCKTDADQPRKTEPCLDWKAFAL